MGHHPRQAWTSPSRFTHSFPLEPPDEPEPEPVLPVPEDPDPDDPVPPDPVPVPDPPVPEPPEPEPEPDEPVPPDPDVVPDPVPELPVVPVPEPEPLEPADVPEPPEPEPEPEPPAPVPAAVPVPVPVWPGTEPKTVMPPWSPTAGPPSEAADPPDAGWPAASRPGALFRSPEWPGTMTGGGALWLTRGTEDVGPGVTPPITGL